MQSPETIDEPVGSEVADHRPNHFTPGMRYDTYVLPGQRMVMVNSLYYIQVDLTSGEFMMRSHDELNEACALADVKTAERLAIMVEVAQQMGLARPPVAAPAPKPAASSALRQVQRIDGFALNGKDFVRREEGDAQPQDPANPGT